MPPTTLPNELDTAQRPPSVQERAFAEMNGRRMSVEDYWAWYESTDDAVRAELINGVVFVRQGDPEMMPVTAGHSDPQTDFVTLLRTYSAMTLGTRGMIGTTIAFANANRLEPDAILYIDRSAGGRTGIDEAGYVVGVPELCIEVSNTTLQRDLIDKRAIYERSGVQEYLVHLPQNDGETIAMRNIDGAFASVELTDGCFISETFPGLAIDLNAIATGNSLAALERLQSEIGSEAHQAFVERLSAVSSKSGSEGSESD